MTVRRVVTGSVLAAGLGVAGLLGATPAFAGPGISIDHGTGGTNPIEIGDTSAAGANAIAKPGNTAVAVSIFGPSYADASKGGSTKFGEGNNVVTFGSVAKTGSDSAGNNVLGLGGSVAEINGQHDNVVTVADDTTTDKYSHQNNIVNVAGVAVSKDQYTKPGVFSANVCGVQFSGQGSHVGVPTGTIC